MAKLLKLRRGSTSDHGSFTGAEGEVTVDTTKDTLVVHDGSTAGGHEMLREDMSNLPAGTIDNADINASAAIAGTKISPNFGSQNIVTSGTVVVGSNGSTVSDAGLVVSADDAGAAVFLQRSGSGRFDCSVANESGSLVFRGGSDSSTVAGLTNRMSINGSTGNVTVAQNLDVGAGVDVTGNITVTGNVDGKDISALGITGTTLDNGVTATTQSASDNSTKVATTAYTDTAISNLVDSSPSTLNTLNELAAALGDDANFSTTVTNSIATKLPLAGGTLTGALTGTKLTLVDNGASSPILNIKTDDGSPWGLRIGNDPYSSSDSHGFMGYQNNDGNLYFDLYGNSVYENWYFRQSNGSTTYTSIHLDTSGAVNLNYGGSTKGYTTSSGWSVNGNMVATGNVTAYSDARLKENVETINDALGICGKLRGVSYKWKDMDKTDIGVIAQEVETVLPDIVLTNYHKEADGTETEIKSVDYGKITSVLINAINELKAEVDALKGGS